MPGKARMKFLMATKPNSQDPGDSNDEKDFGATKKKGNKKLPPALRAAAVRRLQKSGGKKNGNN